MQKPKADLIAPKRRRPGQEPIKPGQKLLFKPQVLALIGDPSASTLWDWMQQGLFPLPIELGPPGKRTTMIAWFADEVYEWIATRPRRKLGQHEFRGWREPDTSQKQLVQRRAAKGARMAANVGSSNSA